MSVPKYTSTSCFGSVRRVASAKIQKLMSQLAKTAVEKCCGIAEKRTTKMN